MREINEKSLLSYSDEKRNAAVEKFKIIGSHFTDGVPLSSLSQESGVPLRTLQRWKKSYQDFGLKGLIHQTRSDAEIIKIDPEVKKIIKNIVLKNKNISVATIHRKAADECDSKKLTRPGYYQVYREVKTIPKDLIILAREGSKAYRTEFDLIHTREASRPNEIWQADHTVLDIEVLDEKNQIGRPWLTIIMDDYSRAIAGYYLCFQEPSAMNTALTLYQAIWKKEDKNWYICGIPEKFYTDHGSDFTSNHLEQVAIDLKINLIFSEVSFPRGRGKIERFFQTVNQMLLEKLPGYIKNKNGEKLLTVTEFEEKLNRFIINEYNHNVHTSIKSSPVNRWNESNFLPNMPETLEKLDLLLLQIAKARKVHPDGIHFQGLKYTNINLAAYVGEYVLIRYNPKDLAEIRVFYDERYLCTAISPLISAFTVDIKEITSARNKRRRELNEELTAASSVADAIILSKTKNTASADEKQQKSKLKRYFNE